jgi:hypothetical protein
MPEPMYLLDFRHMSVERVDHPEPPAGIDTGELDVPEDGRSAEITFAVCGSTPASEHEE